MSFFPCDIFLEEKMSTLDIFTNTMRNFENIFDLLPYSKNQNVFSTLLGQANVWKTVWREGLESRK